MVRQNRGGTITSSRWFVAKPRGPERAHRSIGTGWGVAGPGIYLIAVLDCTTGSSTALAPDEPRSTDTVALRKFEGCAKKMFFT